MAVGEKRYIWLRDAYPRYVSLLGVNQRRWSCGCASRLRGDPCERDTLHRRIRREFIERRGHCREYIIYIIYITWHPACQGICCVGSKLCCRNLCPFVANCWRSSIERRRLKLISPSRSVCEYEISLSDKLTQKENITYIFFFKIIVTNTSEFINQVSLNNRKKIRKL